MFSTRTVGKDTLLLLDSGGQYICGTTDITRCIHLGTPTPKQRLAYTRVLQASWFLNSKGVLYRIAARIHSCAAGKLIYKGSLYNRGGYKRAAAHVRPSLL